jgi:hypothetical protein
MYGGMLPLLLATGCEESKGGSGIRDLPKKDAGADVEQPPKEVVVETPWGEKPGEIGRAPGEEAALLGPRSFVVDAQGVAFLLDTQNARIARYEKGAAASSIPLPEGRAFDDIAFASGGFALLERSLISGITFVGSDGAVKSEVPLSDPKLPEPGLLTGLERRSDGFWVDAEGAYSIRVADSSGSGVSPTTRPGLALTDGTIRADVDGTSLLRLWRTPENDTPTLLAALEFGNPVRERTLLATLSDGRVLVAVKVEGPQSDPLVPPEMSHTLVVLKSDGSEAGRKALPLETGDEEVFRRVRLGDDGAVYLLLTNAENVEIAKVVP